MTAYLLCWVNIHGHQRREIDEAIIAQLGKVAHSTALGLANIPASELANGDLGAGRFGKGFLFG